MQSKRILDGVLQHLNLHSAPSLVALEGKVLSTLRNGIPNLESHTASQSDRTYAAHPVNTLDDASEVAAERVAAERVRAKPPAAQ